MASRQDLLLDAAIQVLGSQGIRQLTHRAVDAAAGVPSGSTSNHFRTRDALLAAVVERFVARERHGWEAIAHLVQPRTPAELAAALAAFVRRATGPDRVMTIARYTLFVEGALRPALRRQLAETATAIRRWGAEWLAALGATEPEGACQLLLDQLDGIMLHELVAPGTTRDVERRLTELIAAILPERPTQAT
ncbi:TetR/AcrR family transcriptional regulator [Couchioplanes caeruleus]|uniref:TetR family transcriptional regulator n=2 Tax=Couchioplanes caeruleus TaxID=56438 RepID=A0A1K0GK88_9ACTN|nr:TetR family transcriptional regulator [Couchioplanes caeruleus]OJF12694.1 TetR family transcriptional regulator [Couchioplanes caeruleus subsp. caeruleus]ROP28054.1 TetR family transcriptional regulator [Couchioplanes caeruleus]